MAITDKIRKAFDECTVMAGVENDFECVYITKAAALLYLGEIDAENAKLRELVKALLTCATDGDCDECRLNGATPWHVGKAQLCDGVWEHIRELGIEVN